MSMSCLRIRSSSKSSGPSYTSVTETANGESLSSFFVASFFDDLSSDSLTGLARADGIATSAGRGDSGALTSEMSILFSMLLPIFHHRGLIRERHSHGRAHIVHRRRGNLARPFAASLKDIPSQPRILLEFLAPLLHRTQ